MLATEASLLAVDYYNDLIVDLDEFFAEPKEDTTLIERLTASAWFALGESDTLGFLMKTGSRAIFDSSRNTLIDNVERENGKWFRVPSPNACGFCRMLGTRGPVYHSEHAACASHDWCKCEVHIQRPGSTFTQPAYMRQWHGQYEQARREVRAEGKRTTMKNIVRQWNKNIRLTEGSTDYLHEVA